MSVDNFKPTASLVIDSTKADAGKLAQLEDILYGKNGAGDDQTGATEPRLPLPNEIATLMGSGT